MGKTHRDILVSPEPLKNLVKRDPLCPLLISWIGSGRRFACTAQDAQYWIEEIEGAEIDKVRDVSIRE